MLKFVLGVYIFCFAYKLVEIIVAVLYNYGNSFGAFDELIKI